MGFRGTPWSKSQYYRRKRKAEELDCSIQEVPDMRGRQGTQPSGANHPRWNKGKIRSSHGYTKVRVGVSHPLADPNGYAYEHTLVWVSAGNPVPKNSEVIHHINNQKEDNRIENLALISRSEHNAIHNEEKDHDSQGRFVGKAAAGRTLDGRTWDEFPAVQP